jgi:hypothetical protein
MKRITGAYIGWIPPEGKRWEPLYRTIRCEGGYQSDRTWHYAPTIEKYPGLLYSLKFDPDPLDLPFLLERRMPLSREDYEWDARFLKLPYPKLDLFEYIGRTGGLMGVDPYSTCPVIEPNEDGTYTFESMLWKFDVEVRDSLNPDAQIKASIGADYLPIVIADNRKLGDLPPYFAGLGNEIFNLTIVRIAEHHYIFGRPILVSFDTPVNLYHTPNFALAVGELANV